jgi:hypothetical protein
MKLGRGLLDPVRMRNGKEAAAKNLIAPRPDVMEAGDSLPYIDAMVFEADLDARREGISGPCDRCRLSTALVALVVFMNKPDYLTFLCGDCYAELIRRKEGDVAIAGRVKVRSPRNLLI